MATRASFRGISRRLFSMQSSLQAQVNTTSLSAFDANHSLYDKFRPTHYKPAVDALIKHLALPPAANVIDLGAGTGKFTELIAGRGFNLSAVEVSDGMLATFRKKLPDIPALKGSSYDIPVADHSVDAIFIAQAFHWFADLEALAEFHRVLKTQGKLALVWNFDPKPDKSSVWQYEVAELCWSYEDPDAAPQFRHMRWKEVFETEKAAELFEVPLQQETVYWSYKTRPEDVFQLWLTKSYITNLPESEQAVVKAKIEKILRDKATPELDADGLLDIRMGVYLTWTAAK
ncbi:S-adenosyl-L-methionine-dependent methyltransferase [Myxozyma melibiosi]|uniref:S-adenosyl-L-methionine-dependent methyltransferase n=1 Tax=Myxozyma melibiosi TaxID=54550 RepID=A0ABR1F2A3_9ASCO